MRSVLIVDDNADIRNLLKLALESEDYAVHQAENGSVAQRKLLDGLRPDVILLDLMMPIMDGHEFLRWKNHVLDFAALPVLVISALQEAPGLKGAMGYLKKPIDLGEMFDHLSGLGR